MRGTRLLLPILLIAGAWPLCAHTIPTLEVEAEFTQARGITLHVNVDARLFLAAQPSTLPPVPASWWLDQNEDSRAKTVAEARAYAARTLFFTVGDKKLEPSWKVVAIDSNTMFPLAPTSAEAHLLCEYQGVLPDVPGAFRVNVADNCAVGVILLNSLEESEQRYPQSLFPGESSRAFSLPQGGHPSMAAASSPVQESTGPFHTLLAWGAAEVGTGDSFMALALAAALAGRFRRVMLVLAVFYFGQFLAACATWMGWLPAPPEWMVIAGWCVLVPALGILVLTRFKARFQFSLAGFAVAGLCCGWRPPPIAGQTTLQFLAITCGSEAAHWAWQSAFASVACLACKALERFRVNHVVVRNAP